MELNDICMNESKSGKESVIVKIKSSKNYVEENPYVNTTLANDTSVPDKCENHIYEDLRSTLKNTSHCTGGCVSRFRHYVECIAFSLLGVLLVAVIALAIFIGLPKKEAIDGGWSAWSAWGTCSATCGTGLQRRNRTCSNPAPDTHGKPCFGDVSDNQLCDMNACEALNGGWSDWSEWGTCSVSCGTGLKRKTRTCSNPSPEINGRSCLGDFSDLQHCANVSCEAMDGGWSAWSAWGTCSATCGTGLQRRNRTCSNPAPDKHGKPCFGDVSDNQLCDMNACEAMDGGWSAWSVWGTCSATCGTGLQRRNRTCSNPAPNTHGKPCFGDVSDNQLCDMKACEALDGGWSTWSAWGTCSATCGTGLQRRNRTCSNPKPELHGRHCDGDFSDYQLCAITSCGASGFSESGIIFLSFHLTGGTDRNCKDRMDKGDTTTGFKTIVPDGNNPVQMLCVMNEDGGGWTVIQKRESATDFYQNWQEYRNGFGDYTNFWLGLENIYRLTSQGNYELRVDMKRINNDHAAAKYQIFSIGNEAMLYKLSIGNYSFDPAFNNPGESFLYHDGMKFTTFDNDNDANSDNCAVLYKGGYWYNGCHRNHLNGVYGSIVNSQGINWYTWTDYSESLKYTRMMIRPN